MKASLLLHTVIVYQRLRTMTLERVRAQGEFGNDVKGTELESNAIRIQVIQNYCLDALKWR